MTDCIDHGQKGDRQGYGTAKWDGKTSAAHRKAYAEAVGITRDELVGVLIRHTCNNPRCINPEHLIPGTHSDNMQDRKRDGGVYFKLTQSQADEIKCRLANGERQTALAKEFGVCRQAIGKIKAGTAWA